MTVSSTVLLTTMSGYDHMTLMSMYTGDISPVRIEKLPNFSPSTSNNLMISSEREHFGETVAMINGKVAASCSYYQRTGYYAVKVYNFGLK